VFWFILFKCSGGIKGTGFIGYLEQGLFVLVTNHRVLNSEMCAKNSKIRFETLDFQIALDNVLLENPQYKWSSQDEVLYYCICT